jgi:predicted alpha/beta-hydrolase family hydrolase
MRHAFMEALSAALNAAGSATLRFNYPYSERGGGGMDGEAVRLATVRAAADTARELARGLPVFVAGHSMSGRMFSLAASQQPIPSVRGIVFFAFPLHAGKPNAERAQHLVELDVPMLFLSGSRDKMAELSLLESTVAPLVRATLHIIDTADHGFKVLKRRISTEPVMDELARKVRDWCDAQMSESITP